ncbi:MAG: deoxynucleoside kinase [Candidatus Andersenbacteria bacterium]|nr:deoxynucleoside kinase [Candidatus Andersenbacteria bacterium]
MGTFVVIESSDAAGGSTQTDLLVKRIKKSGYTPHQFHFPQEDEPTGQIIYGKFLRAKNKGHFSKREQALLYVQDFYSRSKEFFAIIDSGKKNVIVSDRYCTSTMVYQTAGMSGKIRKKMMAWLTWLAWEDEPRLPRPDLVIFLDIPVEVALERLKSKKVDYHERRDMLLRFRRSYLRLAKEQGWVTVNAVDAKGESRSREDIHEDIWQITRKTIT